MKDNINKRYEMDHLRRWLASGVPLSVHTSNGWYGQVERMERFKSRALNADNEDDSLDFSFAFFQACFHLKDWISTFENISQSDWKRLWEKFVHKNLCIKYCRDLCNVTKHMTITKASVTENIVITRNFLEDGSELVKFNGWTLHIEDKQIDLFELMNECTEAWKSFITEDLFDSREMSKHFEKRQQSNKIF